MLDLQKNKWKIFFGVTIIGFFLDWLTKYLAVSKLQMGIPLPVIGSVLQWQLIFNSGGLFGFNPKTSLSEGLKRMIVWAQALET